MGSAPTAKDLIRGLIERASQCLLVAARSVDRDAFYAKGQSGTSLAWAVGHCACVNDLFRVWLSDKKGARRYLRPEMHGVFNPYDLELQPSAARRWRFSRRSYSQARLIQDLERSTRHVIAKLERFDLCRWGDPPGTKDYQSFETCGDMWVFLALHMTWHAGEVAGSVPYFGDTDLLNLATHELALPSADNPSRPITQVGA